MVDCMSPVLSQEWYNLMCLMELIAAFKYNLKHRPVCSRSGVVHLMVLVRRTGVLRTAAIFFFRVMPSSEL